jgi:hypothetical protein
MGAKGAGKRKESHKRAAEQHHAGKEEQQM